MNEKSRPEKDGPPTKRCPHCRKTKPLPAFGVRVVKGVEHVQSWCRECRGEKPPPVH